MLGSWLNFELIWSCIAHTGRNMSDRVALSTLNTLSAKTYIYVQNHDFRAYLIFWALCIFNFKELLPAPADLKVELTSIPKMGLNWL